MKYDRTLIAYHGCDAEAAEHLLRGEAIDNSKYDYDGSVRLASTRVNCASREPGR